MPATAHTFALETYAKRNINYLTRMVDEDAVPYFTVLWHEDGVAEAVHAWPDYTDVMMRQIQACMMLRHMCGESVPLEGTWYDMAASLLDPDSGFMLPPVHPWTANIDFRERQRHAVHTFVTQHLDAGDTVSRGIVLKMVDGLRAQADRGELLPGGLGSGFFIKSLTLCARHMDYEPAAELAGRFVDWIFEESPLFAPDNTFRHGGHVHGNCKCLAGAADYALLVNDPTLFSRVDALYRYVRSESTAFGFVPEAMGRRDDIRPCEACTIMDYMGLAVTLANHGHPEYWGDVERVTRNHLIESQVADASWMKSDPSRPDTEQCTWSDVGERMVGGYGGWMSPNHMLAAFQRSRNGFQRTEDGGRCRLFQNCCGGSGTHALFMAWKNAARVDGGCLSVHMHLDKLLPQAEIRCFQPYHGTLRITLRDASKVRVRIPDFVTAREMRVESENSRTREAHAAPVEFQVWGNYIELGAREAGETLQITYPLPLREEESVLGNPGYRQYRYRVTWKGDTVVRLEPLEDYRMGFLRGQVDEVPLYYGSDGPGLLYQRGHLVQDDVPELSPIHLDDGSMDLWFLR